jgi:hypothetical protein
MIPPRAGCAGAALFVLSCGARLLDLPSGSGTPAPDAAEAVDQATRACRAVSSITAAISVSGSIGGRRVRGRLDVGAAAPASARLEAVAPFGLLFTFVARGDEATLVLHRDRRVLEGGRPEAVLEAVTGVPLDAPALRQALTGCAAGFSIDGARQFGDGWRSVQAGDDLVYLRRLSPNEPWRLVAVVYRGQPGRPEWRAEYRQFEDGLPRIVRFTSRPRDAFDLTLELSQLELNTPLGPAVFEVNVPPSFDPITLDELRRAGPFAGGAADDGP